MARKAEPNATAQMIEDLWDKLNEKYDDDYFEIMAEKDMKVIFNTENMSMPWWKYDFGDGVGFYEINGTTIALCCAGGDWEIPVYFALYVEKGGKKLRMYIPTIGNVFDGYCKTAFGSAGEYGDKMPEDCWPEDFLDEEHGEDNYSDYQYYIQSHESVDDMLKDIGARIEGATPVVPFDKKPLKWDNTAKEWIKQQANHEHHSEEDDEITTFVKIKDGTTQEELVDLVKQTIWEQKGEKKEDNWQYENPFYFVPEHDNLPIQFEGENCVLPWDSSEGDFDSSEVGYYKILCNYMAKSATVAICSCAGDWEEPVYYILYKGVDDKLHMYVPLLGNVFDIYTHTAFGSDTEYYHGDVKEVWPEAFWSALDEDGNLWLGDDEDSEFSNWMERIKNSADCAKMLEEMVKKHEGESIHNSAYSYLYYIEEDNKLSNEDNKLSNNEVSEHTSCNCDHNCGCHHEDNHKDNTLTFDGLKKMKREYDRLSNQNKKINLELTYDELMELLKMMKI